MDTIQTAYSMHRISKFSFFVMRWLPLIVLTILAYRWSDWWLLLGVPIAFIGGGMALYKRGVFLFGLSLPVMVYWVMHGFSLRDYPTIFLSCLAFGFLCGIFGYGYEHEAVKIVHEIKGREGQE